METLIGLRADIGSTMDGGLIFSTIPSGLTEPYGRATILENTHRFGVVGNGEYLRLFIFLFAFQFPLLLRTKLSFLLLFPFVFVFTSLIGHVCFSVIEANVSFSPIRSA
jgi:hypothetical protein